MNDRLTSPDLQAKDRDLGKAFRYATMVAVIVASVVVTYRQIDAAIEHESAQATRGLATQASVDVQNAGVTSELRSLREQRERDRDEIAKAFQDIKERLSALEERRR